MENYLFYLIIGIVVFDFLVERFLEFINQRHFKASLPPELAGFYNEEKYKKSQEYLIAKDRFSIITSSFSFILLLLMLCFHGFADVDHWISSFSNNEYLRSVMFFGVLGMGVELLTLPFQLYQTFVIEEKFDFNRTSLLTFTTDKLKSWILSLLLGGGLLLFVQWAFQTGGTSFWVITMAGLSTFIIFMAMFYTSLIVPLFNKLKPLEDGELKTAIDRFADTAGFELSNIYVMDGSKRSSKANAYFSGLGSRKKIILYDTLIKDLTTQEIVAVLAHEVGHYKKNHIYKGLLFSLLQMGLMLLLLWWALGQPALSLAVGARQASFYMGLLAFSLLYTPLSFLLGIPNQLFSRKYEYEADAFARSHGFGKNLINALIKLSVNSLSNLQPHPVYVFFYYSHPTLLQRKRAIEFGLE